MASNVAESLEVNWGKNKHSGSLNVRANNVTQPCSLIINVCYQRLLAYALKETLQLFFTICMSCKLFTKYTVTQKLRPALVLSAFYWYEIWVKFSTRLTCVINKFDKEAHTVYYSLYLNGSFDLI